MRYKVRMRIQWFPGHMTTAREAAAEAMANVDLVIEVLDARIPHSSCNPLIEALRMKRQRPALKLLNKADLADPERTRAWLEHYNARPGVRAVALDATARGDVARIPSACRQLAPHRGTIEKPLRMMIMGVPNVGKSTLLNTLLKRRVAKVGDAPAITKVQQRLQLGEDMWLIDTPGMLWPKLELQGGVHLAVCNAVGPAAYRTEDVAAVLAEYLMADYPGALAGRYGAQPTVATGQELLAWVAAQCHLQGDRGEPESTRAADRLLHDFRAGALGRISLETPAQVAAWPVEPPAVEKKR